MATNCESCETVGIILPADTVRNGEHVCSDCAADIDSRRARVAYVCDECDTEIEGDSCPAHPKAVVSSIMVREAA